jgi:hypothetical protein
MLHAHLGANSSGRGREQSKSPSINNLCTVRISHFYVLAGWKRDGDAVAGRDRYFPHYFKSIEILKIFGKEKNMA